MSANPLPGQTGCVIVGGGPVGMMLGFLLARAGVHPAPRVDFGQVGG